MSAPATRERVRIVGRGEVFLVVSVDHERQVADLIPLHQGTLAEEDVPFSALEPAGEDLPIDIGHLAPEQNGRGCSAGAWRGVLRRGRFTDGFL